MKSIRQHLISYKTPLKKISQHEVGGKGWNLFRILHSGFPVPRWFVISSRVFDKFIKAHRDRIEQILANVDFTDQAAVDAASSFISQVIIHLDLSRQFSEELSLAVVGILGKETPLSVRSSVIGEDSKENSFAGQMDSFLNVRQDQVINAVRKVWASAFSSRALIYRHRKKINLTDTSTAVIVQEMIQSAASGVLFTRDPESRAKQCVISAGLGLGEGVVQDSVESDTYRMAWDSDEILKEVAPKKHRVVADTLQSGTRKEPVPPELKSKQVLNDLQIRQLAQTGLKLEQCFHAPQDVEWAFDQRGRLFILQARPIVSASGNASSPTIRIWDNSNIVESYPHLTLPLTFSFVRTGYEKIFRKATLGFLLFKKELKKELPIFKNMIGLLDGRVYYNLLNWYRMLSYLPGFKKHKKSWDQMIGISRKISFPESKLSPLNKLCSVVKVIWTLLTVKGIARKFFAHFNPLYDSYKDINISSATEDELIAIYESLGEEFTDKWHLTLYNDFCAMKYYDRLKRLCKRWGFSNYPNLHNNLLCGEKDIESVKPLRSLVRLAEMFRKDPVHRALLSEDDNSVIWKKIESDDRCVGLKHALEDHLKAFGDRGVEELKLERPTFREDPAALIELVKNYYLSNLSVEAMENKEQKIRRDAENTVRRHLRNPFKLLIFRFVLRNARQAIANRENMRFARSRLFGIVRRLFRRMADLLLEKGVLQSSSDIYYLTVDEVFGFVQGTAMTQNLKALVKIRKQEYKGFARQTVKERIETTGIPYLNSLREVPTSDEKKKKLNGIGCSSGIAQGRARVVLDPKSKLANDKHILVTRSTDPGWVFLMISSRGIVVEKGSVLSHTAIIGRELGIPTIVGVKDATRLIRDGDSISINGNIGEVRWQ